MASVDRLKQWWEQRQHERAIARDRRWAHRYFQEAGRFLRRGDDVNLSRALRELGWAEECVLSDTDRERLERLKNDSRLAAYRERLQAEERERRARARELAPLLERAAAYEHGMYERGYRGCKGCEAWYPRKADGIPYCPSCRAGFAGARDLRRRMG